MAQNIYVIEINKLPQGTWLHELQDLTPSELHSKAVEVMTIEQAVSQLNNPDNPIYPSERFFFVYKNVPDEEIHITMGKDDWQELVINNDLQIHINTNGGEGYNVDLYAYNENTPDEERDYDNEFITSCYASFQELNEARQPIDEDEE